MKPITLARYQPSGRLWKRCVAVWLLAVVNWKLRRLERARAASDEPYDFIQGGR